MTCKTTEVLSSSSKPIPVPDSLSLYNYNSVQVCRPWSVWHQTQRGNSRVSSSPNTLLVVTRSNSFFPHSKTEIHRNGFFPTAICLWNIIPPHAPATNSPGLQVHHWGPIEKCLICLSPIWSLVFNFSLLSCTIPKLYSIFLLCTPPVVACCPNYLDSHSIVKKKSDGV